MTSTSTTHCDCVDRPPEIDSLDAAELAAELRRLARHARCVLRKPHTSAAFALKRRILYLQGQAGGLPTAEIHRWLEGLRRLIESVP